jgi:hypothetical protein
MIHCQTHPHQVKIDLRASDSFLRCWPGVEHTQANKRTLGPRTRGSGLEVIIIDLRSARVKIAGGGDKATSRLAPVSGPASASGFKSIVVSS